MVLIPGTTAPLIRGGTRIAMFLCGEHRAVLVKNPECFGSMKYPHVLIVFRAIDSTPPIMFVTAEQNLLENELLAIRPEGSDFDWGDDGSNQVFLSTFDENGHHNLGSSEDWAVLERFEKKALNVMRDWLHTTASVETLVDVRKGQSFDDGIGGLSGFVKRLFRGGKS